MALFRRNKSKKGDDSLEADSGEEARPAGDEQPRVGVVSGVLSPQPDRDGPSPFESVVERRFGPDPSRGPAPESATTKHRIEDPIEMSEVVEETEEILDDESDALNLEIDPMAHIGNLTTIIGNIVAEEDLEIQGTIDGSVELSGHRLIVGSEGVVKASVHARAVEVIGRITGNVDATELVEIRAGGFIGGDIKSPRVIMNDGAIVVGGLDMSDALPRREGSKKTEPETEPESEMPDKPKLIRVEPTETRDFEDGSA